MRPLRFRSRRVGVLGLALGPAAAAPLLAAGAEANATVPLAGGFVGAAFAGAVLGILVLEGWRRWRERREAGARGRTTAKWEAIATRQEGRLRWRTETGAWQAGPPAACPWSRLEPATAAALERRLAAAMANRSPRFIQQFQDAEDDGGRWREETIALQPQPDGTVRVSGRVRDVTAERETDAARQADQERLGAQLARTDCLLWGAEVELREGGWSWRFKIQRTRLSQQLVGQEEHLMERGLWYRFDIPEQPDMDRRCREALQSGAEGYEQEFHIVRPDGVMWLREIVSIHRADERHFSLVGVATDITEQREAVRARIASEERLRQLLDHADCMLWQARVTREAAGGFRWEWFVPRSDLYRRIVGDDPAVPAGMPWNASIVPEFEEIEKRSREAMLTGQPGYEQEFRVLHDGHVIWLHEQVTIEPVGSDEWKLDGVAIDVSAQRLAEEARSVSEAQLRQVVETADFLLWHARVFRSGDEPFRWALTVPPSNLYRRLFDQEPEVRWPVMPWDQLVDAPQRADMVGRADEAILAGESGYEQDIRAEKDGRVIWLHEQATIRPVAPGEWQLVGVVSDVSARREAELARRASEEVLTEILERADCLLWRADVMRIDDRLQWGQFDIPRSRLWLDLFGDQSGLAAEKLWTLLEVPELEEMNVLARTAILGGLAGYEQEFSAQRGGRKFWLHERVSIRPRGPGRWQLVGLVTDVTERHLAEEARRNSEARLERLLDSANCTIWQAQVARKEGRHVWATYVARSRLFRRIFGADLGDSRELDWSSVGVPEFDEMVARCRTAIDADAPGYEQIFHVPQPDGAIWLAEQVVIRPAGPDRWDLVGVITDITARHEAEEARRESEAQLQQIMERADCLVWQAVAVPTPDGRYAWTLFAPRSVLHRRLFGDRGEPGLEWHRLEVPEMAEMEQRALNALRSGAPGYEQEFRAIVARKVIWLREVVTITPCEGGRSRLVGVITDITAQREAEEARRASTAQVDQILTAADCLIWQARAFRRPQDDMRWVLMIPRSRLYHDLFGEDPGDPPFLDWLRVVDPETNDQINRHSTEALLGGLPGYEQEFRAQRGARTFWLHETVSITPARTYDSRRRASRRRPAPAAHRPSADRRATPPTAASVESAPPTANAAPAARQ